MINFEIYTGAQEAEANKSVNKNQAAIYVGTTGTLVVEFQEGGQPISFIGVPAGTILPIRIYQATTVTAGTLILYK